MLYKTTGIVFKTTRYSDSSIIVHVYTKLFGIRSYMVNGAFGKKAKIKASVFQPLSMVEMNVSNREKSSLHRIQDIVHIRPWSSISYDINKSSVVLFLNEILFKTIKEEEANPPLFEFISEALEILDLSKASCANFHLVFLCRLSIHLGFEPHGSYSPQNTIFNLQEGCFELRIPSHQHFMSPDIAEIFSMALCTDLKSSHELEINPNQRKELLLKIIEFYQLHVVSLKEIKSHRVLQEVMG